MSATPEWQEKMAGYVLGDLSEDERNQFEQWLAAHPEARAELARLEETLALLPYGLAEQPDPPGSVKERLMAAAGERQAPPRRARSSAWPGWVPIAVVAGLAVVFGVDNLRLRKQLADSEVALTRYRDVVAMLSEDRTRLVSLRGMDVSPDASGNILITPGLSEVVVTLRNLPDPPKGEVYKLWAVVGGRKVLCGEFMPNVGGGVYAKLPLTDSLLSSPLIVTRERTNSTTPSGPMVMTSSV